MRIGLLGVVEQYDTFYVNTRDLIGHITENLGNLMFRWSTQRVLERNDIEFGSLTFQDDPDWIKDTFDLIIYPTANQVNPSLKHLGSHATFFEKANCPLIVLGLGAQFQDEEQVRPIAFGTINYSLLTGNLQALENNRCQGSLDCSHLKRLRDRQY